MKKILLLFLITVMTISTITYGEENSSSSANLWSAQKMVDDFGDVIEGSMPIIQSSFSGDFSNTATASSELAGYIFMHMLDGYPTFSLRLLEYGDHPATYTSSDELIFKIKIDETIIEFHPVLGTPPNGDLVIYDSSETLYTALYNGTDVRCVAKIGNSKYNFTLFAENFADICDETGYITQSLLFRQTDMETLYAQAKEYAEARDYANAIACLEYLDDYMDCRDLLLEIACNGYYYNDAGEDYIDVKNAWQQFFDVQTAVPLTDEEIKEVIVGNWSSHEGNNYSIYEEDGEYHYFMGGQESNPNIATTWCVEGGRLYRENQYTNTEMTLYHLYENVYVFCTHQSSSDVYELYFHNMF